jgi:hypothetical protein
MGLRNKQYCIFNEQYSKEGYFKEIEKLNIKSYTSLKDIESKFFELKKKLPHKYATIVQSVNVTGNDISKAKNCHDCFSISIDMENCAYAYILDRSKEVFDISMGYLLDFSYEGLSTLEGNNMRMSNTSWGSHDGTYVDNCHTCGEVFGCVGLHNKQYCILNKQYTKEEYKKLLPKIIKQINDQSYIDNKNIVYKYGEFFPPNLSPFCYNETIAQEYFPLSKEEALERGYKWKEKEKRDYVIEIKIQDIPDNIENTKDYIVGKVLECEHKGTCKEQCTEAFKIIGAELQFYKRMNLPIPHLCPNCRYYQRSKQRNPLKLWHRECMCDKKTHTHKGKCEVEFETSYSPDRPEIVYCEKCYQQEVY